MVASSKGLKEKKDASEFCYNCGLKGYKRNVCPNKTKETKCFKCNLLFEQITARCTNKVLD